jgi:hypothetical protein
MKSFKQFLKEIVILPDHITYLYHRTTESKAKKIEKEGLKRGHLDTDKESWKAVHPKGITMVVDRKYLPKDVHIAGGPSKEFGFAGYIASPSISGEKQKWSKPLPAKRLID